VRRAVLHIWVYTGPFWSKMRNYPSSILCRPTRPVRAAPLRLNSPGLLAPNLSPLPVAMQRVSQLAVRRLLSPPSAAAAARRAPPVAAEAVSGGGVPLLPRGGGAGVLPLNLPRFLGSISIPCRALSSRGACDLDSGGGEWVEWRRIGDPASSEAVHLRRERYLRWLHFYYSN
jgi:hypothetical protein